MFHLPAATILNKDLDGHCASSAPLCFVWY